MFAVGRSIAGVCSERLAQKGITWSSNSELAEVRHEHA
jgi:hypothetical protein